MMNVKVVSVVDAGAMALGTIAVLIAAVQSEQRDQRPASELETGSETTDAGGRPAAPAGDGGVLRW